MWAISLTNTLAIFGKALLSKAIFILGELKIISFLTCIFYFFFCFFKTPVIP
jgi:hypothetical protein